MMSPDSTAGIEVLLDRRVIATLDSDAVVGQDVMFGLSSRHTFTARIPVQHAKGLWVIPRSALERSLAKDRRGQLWRGVRRGGAREGQAGAEQARRATVALLLGHLSHPAAHVRLRLWPSTSHEFRQALLEAVEVELHPAGAQICAEGEDQTSCFCVHRGEAVVKDRRRRGGQTARRRRRGAPRGRPQAVRLERLVGRGGDAGRVRAQTGGGRGQDRLRRVEPGPGERAEELRQRFPRELKLLDMVATEHLKLLQPWAPPVTEAPIFRGCDADFLRELSAAMRSQVCPAGCVLAREGDRGSRVFCLARGWAAVHSRRARHSGVLAAASFPSDGAQDKAEAEDAEPLARLGAGAWFGELAALGFVDRRAATVTAVSACDVRVLPLLALCGLLHRRRDQTGPWLALAEQHGHTLPPPPALETLRVLKGLSPEFLGQLDSLMAHQVAFRGQPLLLQRQAAEDVFVLTTGSVSLEVDGEPVAKVSAPLLLGERWASCCPRSRAR
ncbi:unnamed protein product [Prorocentrum cordatum]|uniref:Cyclic nucleotide-binding domain-containing protein n=1 Tax=Prorocentrum cordatum TaxID=2364126 RepID=A0ABN9T7V8_9DINO|nr:unnamed protein product [Polarella glacialis]